MGPPCLQKYWNRDNWNIYIHLEMYTYWEIYNCTVYTFHQILYSILTSVVEPAPASKDAAAPAPCSSSFGFSSSFSTLPFVRENYIWKNSLKVHFYMTTFILIKLYFQLEIKQLYS